MTTNIDDTFNAPRVPELPKTKPTRDEVLAFLTFSAPREVKTGKGPMHVREAKPTPEFYEIWRTDQAWLRGQGYSISEWPKGSGKWKVSKWEPVPTAIVLQRQESIAASRATDAAVVLPCPEGLEYLGYQKAGIAYGHTRPATLLADEPGLGKTIQAIGIINCDDSIRRILIICPASLKLNWKRELEKWMMKPRAIFVADGKLLPDMLGVIIINYDVLRKHAETLRNIEWDLVIADEAHALKNPKSQRTKCVFGVRATKKEKDNGAADVPGITARKRLLLTGTPITNRPIELFPLLEWLDPINWGNFFRFGIRYCGANNNSGHWDFSGASNLDELQQKLRETIMVRRLKKDVLPDLPAKTRKIVELQPSGEALDIVRMELAVYGDEEQQADDVAELELLKASDDEAAYLAAVDKMSGKVQASFTEIAALRCRVAVAKVKMPETMELLEQAVEESGKVIIFAHHREVIAHVFNHFGRAAVQIHGDITLPERQAAVDRFQNDPSVKVFVGGIIPAGVGLTLTASSHVIFLELDWVPGNVSQAEDRAHRIGQKDNVYVEHYVLTGSLDARMVKTIVEKQVIIDAALDKIQAGKELTSNATGGGTVVTFDKLAAEAATMTHAQRLAAVASIRVLAERCNGARDWDGAGFNKIDTRLGKDLAAMPNHSPKQAALCRKIALKYSRQLGPALVAAMKG